MVKRISRITEPSGTTLVGLAQALRSHGKDTESAAAEARFLKAWTDTDVMLAASRFKRECSKLLL